VSLERFLELVHPEDRKRVRRRIARAYEDGRAFAFDYRIVLPDGVSRTMHARGEVIADDDGRPARMVGTAQDVTERQRLDDLRNDILSAVSHELRTPLSSILGFSVTLQERGASIGEETVGEIVDHLVHQTRKLDRLLSDLLDVDRFRRGLAHANRRPTNIGSLVESVVAAQPGDGHVIVVDAEPVVAEVDAPKVERIVDNLIANASKYSPTGSQISVYVEGSGDGVLIAIDDTGPGVPDGAKQSIFNVFERGVDADHSVPGTGIGLALVSQFAVLHGGRAWVEDNPAGGSSFRVLLPHR